MDRHLVSLQVPWIFVQVPGHQILWSSQWLERFLEGGRFISWNHQSVGPKHTQHRNFPVLLRPPKKWHAVAYFPLWSLLQWLVWRYTMLPYTKNIDTSCWPWIIYIKEHLHSFRVLQNNIWSFDPSKDSRKLHWISFSTINLPPSSRVVRSLLWDGFRLLASPELLSSTCLRWHYFLLRRDQWVTGWCSCGWLTVKRHWRLIISNWFACVCPSTVSPCITYLKIDLRCYHSIGHLSCGIPPLYLTFRHIFEELASPTEPTSETHRRKGSYWQK